MDSIVFTFSLLKHTEADYFISSYLKNAAYALASALLFTYIYKKALRKKLFALRLTLVALPVAVAIFSAAVFEKRSGALRYVSDAARNSSFIEEHYSVPAVSYPPEKRNLVLIVIESAENSLNTAFEKPLMPLLAGYQKENTAFDKYIPLYKTGNTIGSLVAFYFGLPLILPHQDANRLNTRSFMPKALSIFEVFTDGGYKIYFATGAQKEFSSKGGIFTAHARGGEGVEIFDKAFFLELGYPVVGDWWGQADKYVYEFSKAKLLERAAKDQPPFVYIIETIDTHGPDGMLYGDFPVEYGDYRDSFRAADFMAYDFVEWLKAQEFYENTTVILTGDHPINQPITRWTSDLSKFSHRAIFNVFLNTPMADCADKRNKIYSALDMAPTILESVGITLSDGRFGLGVSLCSSQPALVEQYGAKNLNREFGSSSIFYRNFW